MRAILRFDTNFQPKYDSKNIMILVLRPRILIKNINDIRHDKDFCRLEVLNFSLDINLRGQKNKICNILHNRHLTFEFWNMPSSNRSSKT